MLFDEKYVIKWGKELAWALLVGVIGYLAVELAATDLDSIDIEAFAIALLVGCGRLALAIVLNAVRTLLSRGEQPPPAAGTPTTGPDPAAKPPPAA